MTALHLPATAARTLCDHCGLPVPRALVEPHADLQFCCHGCRTVYDTLHAEGLDDYYRLREMTGATPQAAATTGGRYVPLDDPQFIEQRCVKLADGSLAVDLQLEGVHCAACVWLVEKLPRITKGVVNARLSLRDAIVRVSWRPEAVPLSKIAQTLDRLGYPAHATGDRSASELRRRAERRQLIRLGVAGACAGNVMLLAIALYAGDLSGIEPQFVTLFRWLSAAIGGVSLVWPGAIFFRGGWAALQARSINLDVPIALALAAGGVVGLLNVITGRGDIYFDSLSVLVFLLLVGRWFQSRQQRWADEAVGLMQSFTPASVRIVRDDTTSELPLELLSIGDLVEVRSGELLPADGTVERGDSTINRALLTGEAQPVPVVPGDAVYAGTQNLGGLLRVRVAVVGTQTRVGQLLQLVEQGVREKPPIVAFADRVASYLTVTVTALACLTFAAWTMWSGLLPAIDHTVALLIVACPCALGLATPLTMALAIGRAAQRQVLVKNATAFQKLAGHGQLLVDKTGTLTHGRPVVLGYEGNPHWQTLIARLERHSSHPVAAALVNAFGDRESQRDPYPHNIREQLGAGVTAEWNAQRVVLGSPRFLHEQGIDCHTAWNLPHSSASAIAATTIGLAVDGQVVARIALGDELRSDSAQAIRELSDDGWQASIISGDNQQVVESVAQQVGMDVGTVRGNVTPEQKLDIVRHSHTTAVMVGDGVNDAAALAAADVGIAVQGGAAAALAAADIYVAQPGLMPIVDLIALARRTLRVARRNLVISLAYNVVAVTLAACGMITPLVAALLMPLSSASVLASAYFGIAGEQRT